MRRFHRFLSILLLSTLPSLARAEPVSGTKGMVASAHPLASEAGLQMLRAGGTACDAAVAVAFALGVVEPYSSGIGGGGFALVRFNQDMHFMDFREVAPQKASAGMFAAGGVPNAHKARDGSLAVAVPGAVAGYVALHKQCGKLPLSRVMAPAIDAATHGVAVDLRYIAHAQRRLEVMGADADAARIFLTRAPDGTWKVPAVGQLVVQKDLAKTLKRIATGGVDAFYKGALAAEMVKSLESKGGILTREDLANYKVRERKPLTGTFRGNLVVTAPPPSSGGQILLTLLNFMETLPPRTPWHDGPWLQMFVEASKRAYADRVLLGDPDYVKAVAEQLPLLLAKERVAALAPALDKVTPAKEVAPGSGTSIVSAAARAPEEGPHTTHLSVLDAAGNAVTMTTTVNYNFGAGIVAGNSGVLWNDEMDDFAVDVGVPNVYGIVGSEANKVAAGKVPLSSMTPTFVFAGGTEKNPLRLIVGSPGGSRIPSTVAQVVLAVMDAGADVRTAVSLGRVHHQHLPDETYVEHFGMEPATIELLHHLGYSVTPQLPWCDAMAIAIDPATGIRTAAADPRGVGVALAEP